MANDRSEYRNHIIEITVSQEPNGRWQGDWAVFEAQPFLAVAAGGLDVARETAAGARAVAWRQATLWVDGFLGGSDADAATNRVAVSRRKRR